MKKIILLLVFVFSIGFASGQVTFFKTITGIDESANYIEQATDGGYVIMGTSLSSTDINGYVVKTDALGDTIWTKIYGNQTRLKSGMQTSDGGYICIGSMRNGFADQDIYVLKIDSVGLIEWQKIIGLGDDDYGYDIKQTSDTGYVIIGTTQSIGAGLSDICVIKLDAYGSLQWSSILGTPDYESGASIQELSNGGYVLTGTIFNGANSAAMVTKLNSSGSILWTKAFSGTTYDSGSDIIQTSDSGFLIAGNSGGMSLIKTDSMGNFSWGKEYAGAASIASLKRTNDGNYIISASRFAYGELKMLFTLIDSSGSELWTRFMSSHYPSSMGYYSTGTDAQQTADGGYVFTGYATTAALQGFIYFIKADSLGRSGCDSTATLVVNTFSPTVTAPSISNSSTILIAGTTYLSGFRADTIITFCTTVGINEQQASSQITVYPNPSSGQFNFSGLEKENKIEVFDMTGKKVYEVNCNSDIQSIDISESAKGIYFYRITKEMRLVQSGKICVQ